MGLTAAFCASQGGADPEGCRGGLSERQAGGRAEGSKGDPVGPGEGEVQVGEEGGRGERRAGGKAQRGRVMRSEDDTA